MTIGYNRPQVEGPFENVMYETTSYREAKEHPQRNYVITKEGWDYLRAIGKDILSSRKTLEELFAENSMIEGKHFIVEVVGYEMQEVFKNGQRILPFSLLEEKLKKDFRRGWAGADLVSSSKKKDKPSRNN
jgi:hypothetical protein